jgi:serine/threonine protein kinase
MANHEPWQERWKLVRMINKGGQGVAKEVESLADPSVRGVLKQLLNNKPQNRRRMHQEVTSLQLLASAGIKVPRVLDGNTEKYEDEKVALYFVMDFIPGNTLEEVSSRGRLSLEESVAISLELCSTIKAAHAENVLHRDLKPDNIILRRFDPPDAVIVDFGLSFNEEGQDSITQTGENFRNKFLCLPETNTEEGDRRDKRSDIAAICAVFYFCLTGGIPGQLLDGKGRLPHKREKNSVRQFLKDDSRCDQVELLLDQGLAVEIENRFQAIEELVHRLGGILAPFEKGTKKLAQVVVEQKARLRRFDRKTQLIEYSQHIQEVAHILLQCGQEIARQIIPYQMSMSGGSVEQLPVGFDKVGDLPILTIQVPGHSHSGSIYFSVGAKGSQCVLFQTTRFLDQQTPDVLPAKCSALLWYSPDEPPTKEKISILVESSVAAVIEELTDKTVRGQT